ncbi:aminotransferase class I/II-fold pyridoxal phosphate-dependent enzyme [Leuconostoc carnosum]|uniref:Aminotransferase n=1 Tax=Leuconostoc carnosum TaxID=1252 RepID=A0AAE6M4D1_LEUCA|nr:aminotransferase class I/II-fold pyridoxal phosphate-dependent enzyme [Leuconostoc carnosum]KAA8326957.1 aminotransferase class I/II-fold pyridoxal phosphate-dependent enzyme [Leuconostoc carnosum]QEA33681.1 aminotransferase class I/II-fold pyridoxal phosphate-dependent enzyme [Leuconostoc carnosum]
MPKAKTTLLSSFNKRLDLVKPSAIRAFDNEVSEIPNILKLTLGEPDFDVPDHIKAAAIQSIEGNDSHYAASNGTLASRQAVTNFLNNRYGLQYDAESEVIVTVGATEAIYSVLTSLLNSGDKVLLPSPIFPLYIPVTLVGGGEPVFVDTSSNNFVLSPEMLKQAIREHGDSIKAIVLNFPSNPTGVTYSEAEVKALADILRDTSIVVISDEIYSELTYETTHVSMAKYLPEQTILLNGVSKSHAMTGYRIGFLAGPAEVVKKLGLIHQFTVTTVTNSSMAAATEALNTEAGREDTLIMKKQYKERRDFVFDTMTSLGFAIPKPAGAFYIFAKIPEKFEQDDTKFARDLAQKNQLAVVPGSSFGPGGEGYVRLSYAASMSKLQDAMNRLTKYMNGSKR